MTIEIATYASELNPSYPENNSPVSEGAAHLRLVKSTLQTLIPEIGNYTLLRAYSGIVTAFYVRGVATDLDGGHGVFRVDASDTTSADNGGTVLVDVIGRRWRREYAGALRAEWFGAKGDGVTSDSVALASAVSVLTYGESLEGEGTYLLTETLNLLTLAKGADIRLNTLKIDGLALGIALSCNESRIHIKKIVGNSTVGSKAVQVISSFKSDVQVDLIGAVAHGWEINGTYGYSGRNGTIFCNFVSREITCSGIAVEYTTDAKTGGSGPGYVNENDFDAGWINAQHAIKLTKSSGAVYGYDGNVFWRPGFEQITGNAYDIAFANRNKLVGPRFENVTGWHIIEASDCSRNHYDFHYAPGWDKIQLGGVLAVMSGGQIGTFATGDTVSAFTMQTATAGETIFIAPGYNGTSLKPNTMYFKDIYGGLFRDRIECLDSTGARKIIPLKYQTGATTSGNVTAASYSVPVGTDLLQLSAAVQAQTITMPVEMERNGNFILLNAVVATGVNTITIQKSTGAPTATITAAGLYALIYANDGWRVSQIGSAF